MAGRGKTEVLGNRGRALEEAFFAHHERKLLTKAREAAQERSTREELAAASGIHDAAVLDTFAELGLSAETVAAVGLVPLVEVAWADRTIHDKEHAAVLEAAEESGIEPDSPARALLDEWLGAKPPATLFTAWKDYVESLDAALEPGERESLRDELMGRARHIAEAAGGFLGVNKVSAAEKAVLEELERAFSA